MYRTNHAQERAQQRAIPLLIEDWLDAYGEEEFDGKGARVVYFSKKSIRDMERAFGRRPVRKLAEWWDVYKVEDLETSQTITIGRRFRRLRRR